jgi:hypothetical protein
VLVAGGGSAAVEVVVGEEGHIGADLAIEGCPLIGSNVEGARRFLRLRQRCGNQRDATA